MEREHLPNRRPRWGQKVRIGGQTVYLSVGEYPDGRCGEVFIDVAKAGAMLRGTMDALARVTSVALQCGVPMREIVDALCGLNYPPNGRVEGSPVASGALSISDWIGKELEAVYCAQPEEKPNAAV